MEIIQFYFFANIKNEINKWLQLLKLDLIQNQLFASSVYFQ